MDIDWSKAPEGATHFQPAENENRIDLFWRVEHGKARQVWRMRGWKCGNATDFETFTYGPAEGHQPFDISKCIARPSQWAGEGLPPVGTVCEARVPFGVQEVFVWRKVVVAFDRQNGHDVLVFDAETYRPGWADELRPIKTPEQIAAEERDKAVHQMGLDAGFSGSVQQCYERLYDLGYRKVEGGAV